MNSPAAALPWLTPRRLMMASVGVALLTMALKTVAWRITGSVGLLSDAAESLVNLAAAAFGLTMVTVAARPADDDHPYGHHKAEYFASAFEGVLIFVAALAILWTAVPRLWAPQPLEQLGPGLTLSVVSSALNGGLAWLMLRVARRSRSIALEADARHLLTDVWTSAGVVLGLLLVMATGWLWLDAVVAMGVALNIVREGVRLVWRSSQGLMDAAAPAVQTAIEGALADFARVHGGAACPVRFDHVTTRSAAQRQFVDLHMHMPADWTLARGTVMRLDVERALQERVPGARVTIQMLPLGAEAHVGDAPAPLVKDAAQPPVM
ncbi:cation diffusion facilitator family transporter [Ottowia sp.]|uniref:cation diffusion facilitator family transporter n=1 Tax=Ottowia sp. TaxID=1898956 RepID=UPI003A89F5C3